jgi:mercuric ion transport protein
VEQEKKSVAALTTGGVAAVLASACCLGPLLLVMAGAGGAWMAQLQALEPFRPFTLGIALIALAFAYRPVFRRPADCTPGQPCAVPRARFVYKALFWLVAALVAVALAYPYVIPFFL